ncbi:MAG: transglutaminase TgpA family protein [Aeromonadaceae bacterium]
MSRIEPLLASASQPKLVDAQAQLSPRSINRLTLLWLTLSYLLLVIPLYSQLNPLIYLGALLAIGWRYHSHLRGHQPPKRWLLNTIALIASAFIVPLWWYGNLLQAMINLLVLAISLKFLEFHEKRDISVHILALLFLSGVLFVYEQQMAMAAYQLVIQLLCIATLLSLYLPGLWQQQLKMAGKLLLQSLPLMLLLFIIMPRLAPMWRMPDAKLATTGLSEKVAPEDISRLVRSSERVFRATFSGTVPAERYWRVMVHEWFDGHVWSTSPTLSAWFNAVKQGSGQGIRQGKKPDWRGEPQAYTLLLEPNSAHWVYALERSLGPNEEVLLTPYQGLYTRTPTLQAKQLALRYYPEPGQPGKLSELTRKLDLQLPRQGNPRSRELAQQWRSASQNDAEVARRAMDYFRTQGFAYTLEPPLLRGDSIDQLLFDTKQGFCAHYASAFAFLMRAAGIPARLATGYLGGEYDQAANFVSVYQFDAHAWVELWLEGRWQRFDPTLMVTPDRLNQGLDQVTESDFLATDPLSLSRYRGIPLLNELRLVVALIDFRWSVWVLNFNAEQQQQLLAGWWGNQSWGRLLTLLCGLLLAALAAWLIHRLFRPKPRQDPLLRAYHLVCRRLAQQGYPRHPYETPLQYEQRLTNSGYAAAPLLAEITALFNAARYRQRATAERLKVAHTIRRLSRRLGG